MIEEPLRYTPHRRCSDTLIGVRGRRRASTIKLGAETTIALAVQGLQLVMRMIRSDLTALQSDSERIIFWEYAQDDENLGFPAP